jgi:hypothetical protein
MRKGTNNPNGRPKGTPNKITGELRTRIADFLDENFETVKDEFKKLDGEKKMQFYIKLIEYVLPKNRVLEEKPQGESKLPDWLIHEPTEND